MGDSCLIPFDQQTADEVVFNVLTGQGGIDFQFPPKIISDSNSSLWQEEELWAIELLRIHKGSQGRKINFEWEYVATDSIFNGSFIAATLRMLKSYFFQFSRVEYPVVEVDYTAVIPTTTFFRLRDVNIQHGRELVNNGSTYPLYTKVNATLELATSVGSARTSGARGTGEKIKVPPVNIPVNSQWY